MSFTYIGDLSTNLDKLRFEIGDTVEDAGVLPDGSNIPDATMNALVSAEGSVGLAAVRIAGSMKRVWANIASAQSVGSRSETNQQFEHWQTVEKDLIALYGNRSGVQAGMFSVGLVRDDAYHQFNPVANTNVQSQYARRIVYIEL